MNTTICENEAFQLGIQYSEEVKNAVRYGYQYRKKSEEQSFLHYIVGFEAEIVHWLGELIINGITWDLIKKAAKQLYDSCLISNFSLDKQSKTLLSDEKELKQFYTYVKDFNEHSMTVREEQYEYIKEEICADFFAKESMKIFESEHRFPNHQEIIACHKATKLYAEKLLNKKEM